MDDSFFCYDHHRSRRFRFVMNDVYLSAACLLTRLSTAQSTVGTVGQRERERSVRVGESRDGSFGNQSHAEMKTRPMANNNNNNSSSNNKIEIRRNVPYNFPYNYPSVSNHLSIPIVLPIGTVYHLPLNMLIIM